MNPIATDTYNFERLMTDGYTYVDKTEVLYPLINKSIGSQFFLSRPRRFGKSLLVSTFKSLFQGRRDLFKGLAIDSLEYDWKTYPVLHLDMGSMQRPTVEAFEDFLCRSLDRLANEHEVVISDSKIPADKFISLCEALVAKSPHKQFVMLVDEYDKPASEAMEQIKGKDYAGKYALSGKRMTLIAISFSSEKRTIVEELVEEMEG